MTKRQRRDYQYDVFLSHNNLDEPLVESLADRLDKQGLKPFLDKWHLVPGEPWQEAIEEALDNSATCVVFLGPGGIGPWENEEMRSALDERVRNRSFRVVPVVLPGANLKNPANLPRFLRRLTWVDFRSGIDDHEAFRRLVAGIRGYAPGGGTIGAASDGLTSALKQSYSLLLLTLPTLVVIVAVVLLMNSPIPTRVQVDLTVDRTVFTVGGIDSAPILNTVRFRSATLEKFARIDFSPAKLEVADPAKYEPKEDRYADSAWKPLKVGSALAIMPGDETLQPAVTLESTTSKANIAGVLDQLWAQPGSEVTLELGGVQSGTLSVRIDSQQSSATLSFREPFLLLTSYSRLSGISGLPYEADAITYRAVPSSRDAELRVAGLPRSLVFILTRPPEKMTALFPKGGIPVTSLDFTRQGATGNRVTALVRDGEISFPDYPRIDKVAFRASDFVRLDRLEKFRLDEIALDPEHKGIRLHLSGIAGHVTTGSPEFAKDHRLSRFDALSHNPQLITLLSIMIWVFPTTLGAYKLYRKSKK